jgi:hypothetical protein
MKRFILDVPVSLHRRVKAACAKRGLKTSVVLRDLEREFPDAPEVPSMSHFLLTFGDPRQPPFAAAILEAPSMAQARMTAVVRRLASGLPFGEGLKLNDEMMTLIPPKQIGRTLSGEEDGIDPSACRVARKNGAERGEGSGGPAQRQQG